MEARVQEQLEVLEAHVHKMIGLIRQLKSEKAALQSTLSVWEGELHQLREERTLVLQRVGKMVEVLNGAEPSAEEETA
jgi:hypothetical protein